MSSTSSANSRSRRAPNTSAAPWRANSSAAALPIPELAPPITATLPFNAFIAHPHAV
ncbi:hypothetical protein P5G70_00935 [Serratia nevei]|nr:hypothetical protein [Serratia nevei]